MERERDNHVEKRVMGVLNRNWIDLERTSLVCLHGRVLLKGQLRRKGPRGDCMAPRSVADLERELSETRGVRRVDLNLENWVRGKDGRWCKKDEA